MMLALDLHHVFFGCYDPSVFAHSDLVLYLCLYRIVVCVVLVA